MFFGGNNSFIYKLITFHQECHYLTMWKIFYILFVNDVKFSFICYGWIRSAYDMSHTRPQHFIFKTYIFINLKIFIARQKLLFNLIKLNIQIFISVRSRHRRRNQMLPMMVFGITAFGMIVVPIGFQFLAVLGGKALLLAKMALLLASVNGLKRVFY